MPPSRTLYSKQLSLSSPGVQHAAAVIIAVLAVVARALIAWKTHSTGEDALITLRYAENLARGRGFVYNPGEHVLGVTTPLYALLLTVFYNLHLNAMAAGKSCCIISDGVTCYLLARLMARAEIDKPTAGLFAAVLYAFTSTPVSISIGGMETALVTCAGMGMIYAWVARRPYWLYTLGAVLFLLRIDGLALFVILGAASAIQERKLPLRAGAIALIIVIPWLLYSTLTFGSPVPESLVAKLVVYGATARTGMITSANREAFVDQFVGGVLQAALTGLFLLGAFLTPILATGRRNGGILTIPLIWCLVYYAAMLLSKVPAFPWYFLPPWPVFLAVACLAAATAPQRLAALRPDIAVKFGENAAPISLAVVTLLGLFHLRSVMREVNAAQVLEDTVRKPIGIWFAQHADPSERVMLEPIGYIGYYSSMRVLDSIGLVSPEVLNSYRGEDAKNPLADIVRRLKPEWLCLRKREVAALRSSPDIDLDAEYKLENLPFGSGQFSIYHLRTEKDMHVGAPH